MAITDLNKMTVEELWVISNSLGISYAINDGVIVSAEKEE